MASTEENSSVNLMVTTEDKSLGLVRILKPGKEIPSDLRNYATQVPDIGKTMCAVVDFEQSESALQAVRCLKDDLVEQKMRLALLGPRVRRTLYKQDRGDDEDGDEPLNIEEAVNVEPEADNSFKAKLVANSSNNSSTESTSSNNTTHSSIDLSIDSGNCNISSDHHSETESFDNKDENSQKNLLNERKSNNQNMIIVNNKISTIFREPEGPGVNAENGFAFKRSSN
jgi:hypothetical protein